MVNRRIFLKLSAGATVLVTAAPRVFRPDRLLYGKELWTAPVSRIELCKPAVRMTDGSILLGPGFKSIGPPNTNAREILFNRVEITESCTATGPVLLDYNDAVIHENVFSGGVQQVFNGDSLIITYTIQAWHGSRCRSNTLNDMRYCTCSWRTLAINHSA